MAASLEEVWTLLYPDVEFLGDHATQELSWSKSADRWRRKSREEILAQDYAAAELSARHALRLDGQCLGAQLNLSLALAFQGKLSDDAFGSFSRGSQRIQDSATEKLREAYELFAELGKTLPQDSLRSIACFNAAWVLSLKLEYILLTEDQEAPQRENLQQRIRWHKQALKLNPGNHDSRTALGLLMLLHGDSADSVEKIRKRWWQDDAFLGDLIQRGRRYRPGRLR